ncbi:P-loop NTPase family protein [Halpernia frigidisoli]|uniref:TauD/TfdA-like domain-containing protein n=1 Tax=Halpernia frigidisoli TaxID=1125876 RepID=A0A1I3FRP1_9FLAO|nr:hypothetical protein [Halpernia frigidisoli]SFI13948.1 hypothetical protein SAMN05443292_1584 [Halpernia frigidisoli]
MTELKIDNEDDFLKLACELGRPISSRINGSLIDNLIPLKKENAHKQSLSANFGTSDFPYHTDGAYFKIPPKFILLRYTNGISKPTPTILCNLQNINSFDKQILKHSVWKVKSKDSSFYSSILSEDEKIFRFDNCIMQPIDMKNDNSTHLEKLISSLPKKIINWEINKTVIIDNWKYLHTRPEVKDNEIDFRNIQRIMIQ